MIKEPLVNSIRRIAVLAPFGTLAHQPGTLNAIACFAESGYTVEVFTLRNIRYLPFHYKSGEVNVHYLPVSFRSRRESRVCATILFMFWLPFALKGRYFAVFACGVRALFAAWFASWFYKIRIINYQLELYIDASCNMRFARVFKWIERRAIRSCIFTIEHDKIRARMLCDDVGISLKDVELLPNAPRGQGQILRSNFLRNRLSLGKEVRLLVICGTLHPSYLSEEIVAAVQKLPQEWICVLHSAQPRPDNDPYIARLQALNNQGKAVFSLKPVPYDMVDEIYASADIGLVLYNTAMGSNITEVGLSSGKLCHFLKVGVPVIVSDFLLLREFVTLHRVGVPLADLNDLPHKIAIIMKDYESYCRRATEIFTRELAFQKNFQRVLDRLDSVAWQSI